MIIDPQLKGRIDLALDEARLLGVEFDQDEKLVGCTFAVVSMDKDGNVPEDNRVLFIFKPVGRFVASYRKGAWDDKRAPIKKFEPKDIFKVLQHFKSPIYGDDFINCGDKKFSTWKDRLSFDYSSNTTEGLSNTIDLFQEDHYHKEHIDLRIWFDDLEIFKSGYTRLELEEFLDDGKRGWEAIRDNNSKMARFGILPLKP